MKPAQNDAELKDHWRRYLKFEVLNRYHDKLEEQEKAAADAPRKTNEELEKEAREEQLKLMEDYQSRRRKIRREDRLSDYLNCMTGVFDPHTNYFKPIDKENFDIRFSGRLEGIGARLQGDGDYTKVSDIVVGGPAWKGKELKEGDIILKVAQAGAEPVDIKGMVLDEVVSQVRGPKGTEVRLTVKKSDGTVKEITIIRDIVIIDEQFAKSLIIDGKDPGERIGYIWLPAFYEDFENEDGRDCAVDVGKEIEKLKAENVNGIILDLRNNGGGSLGAVVRMSGFFIEKGPIVQVKSRTQAADVHSDIDPRVQYDGPLVVMVNSYSASASEIMAAALQDYGRAVIVGGKSTFGKATVQRFVDLDRGLPQTYNDVKPLGNVKVTMQKFYRVSGGSNQLRGVIPDVILPDNFAFMDHVGEGEYDYPLEWSEIAPVAYNQNVFKITKLDKIKANSEKRVKNDPLFQRVAENGARLKKMREETSFPLQEAAYRQIMHKRETDAKAFDDLFKETLIASVHNLPVDMPDINIDESKKARNTEWLSSVSKDLYLRETLNVMHDLINMKGLSKN